MKFSTTLLFAIVFLFLYAYAAVIESRRIQPIKPKVEVQLQAEFSDEFIMLTWNRDVKNISPNCFRALDCDKKGCALPIIVNEVVPFGNGRFTLSKELLSSKKIHIAAIRGVTTSGESYGSITPIIANKYGEPEA
ncbi:23744_t:CDS:2 [Dentiscutata erythropus]|uniref:23744_t:CDS:1 n=1 Tax=Dentiscutata erythropus TaxID=1348616 RepID=A0A9N9J7F7_9GLOM|nr:23744_t:CDS:2 [Dentiscutata erythropus]